MKRILPILLISGILLFASCVKTDSTTCYYYNVRNQNNSEIKVIYTFYGYHTGSDPQPDTVIHIGAGEEKTLYVYLLMYSYNSNHENPETGDTLRNILRMDVYKDDTVKSGKNCLLTEYWHYVPPDYGKGELELTVTEEDFIK